MSNKNEPKTVASVRLGWKEELINRIKGRANMNYVSGLMHVGKTNGHQYDVSMARKQAYETVLSDIEAIMGNDNQGRDSNPLETLARADISWCMNALRDNCLSIAKSKGFTEATVAEDLCLFHSEISEALEDHRKGKTPNEYWYTYKHESGPDVVTDKPTRDDGRLTKPCGIPSEMADIIIRVLHFCGKHDIDIAKAIKEKMAFNSTRPHMHGKKL